MRKPKTLGDQLHDLVEESQGYAYISDGINNLSDQRVLQIAQISLAWNLETVKRLKKFIKANLRVNKNA